MPGWIIAAAIGSIVITALLTLALWRMNKPMLERYKKGDGGDGGHAPSHDHHNTSDSSDGGGGDGGGD